MELESVVFELVKLESVGFAPAKLEPEVLAPAKLEPVLPLLKWMTFPEEGDSLTLELKNKRPLLEAHFGHRSISLRKYRVSLGVGLDHIL